MKKVSMHIMNPNVSMDKAIGDMMDAKCFMTFNVIDIKQIYIKVDRHAERKYT